MDAAVLALLPSPDRNVWFVGPVPIRAYAICIILAIVAAVVITERRLRARGGPAGMVTDIAVWAVPFGIVGARIYHVLTSPGAYLGQGGDLLAAFQIWKGGLGIWGAIAGGALGAWIACRQRGLPLTVFADALAPGLAVAQAIGRIGNWFNNELYGRQTDLPWGLEVHRMDTLGGRALEALPGAYHPTFLYEALWCLGVAALVWWADRRFQLGRGRAFALYVMAYTAGRLWIEALRIDPATSFFAGQVDFLGPWFTDGIRINVLTSIVVFLAALAYFVIRRGPRERIEVDDEGIIRVLPDGAAPDGAAASAPAASSTGAGRAPEERPRPYKSDTGSGG
jgi:prolipoprotein diacylglyceryl transferase